MASSERFESHTFVFSLLTLASRVTGLVRDAVLGRVFGASALMDAFFFAFLIPNLFRRLFGEGALSAAFLPAYARLERDDPAMARRLATLTMALLVVATGTLALLGEGVLWLLAMRGDHDHLALRLTVIMLPYMPLVCGVAILGSILQVHGRFGPTAAAPIIANLCMIAAAAGLRPLFGAEGGEGHISAVAASVVVAGALQAGWMLLALRHHPWLARQLAPAWGEMRSVVRRAGPMVLGLGVIQLNVFMDGLIASYPSAIGPTILGIEYPLQPGAMSAVSFAQRLYQFPLGVFGIAVATAIYPALSRLAADEAAFTDVLRRGLRLVLFLGLPASAGLALVGRVLSAVVYQGGDFGPDDAARVAFVLAGYASAVWAYSMIFVLTRAFFARGDTGTPVRLAVWMVALDLALNLTLIWTPLREAGLAWSTGVTATIQALVLLVLVRRHAPDLFAAGLGSSVLKTLALTGAMVLAVVAVRQALPEPVTWTQSLLSLGAQVGAGLAAVIIPALALRLPELRWAVGRE